MHKLLTAIPLTDALRELYGTVTVQVIAQHICSATAEEQAILNIQEDNSWIREVHLVCYGIPRVYARTTAPFATYQKYKLELDNLGNGLLGENFLYKLPHTRSPFEYLKINNQAARRSIFNIDACRLLVTECFLAF